MAKTRDTYLYELKDSREIVYYGITNDPEVRERNHRSDGWRFSHMNVICGPLFRKNAEKIEGGFIHRYQLQHGGKPPRYNIEGLR
jgi:hypothetical protein